MFFAELLPEFEPDLISALPQLEHDHLTGHDDQRLEKERKMYQKSITNSSFYFSEGFSAISVSRNSRDELNAGNGKKWKMENGKKHSLIGFCFGKDFSVFNSSLFQTWETEKGGNPLCLYSFSEDLDTLCLFNPQWNFPSLLDSSFSYLSLHFSLSLKMFQIPNPPFSSSNNFFLRFSVPFNFLPSKTSFVYFSPSFERYFPFFTARWS